MERYQQREKKTPCLIISSCCATCSVNVRVDVCGKIEIDNIGDELEINTTGNS